MALETKSMVMAKQNIEMQKEYDQTFQIYNLLQSEHNDYIH